jgi:hypothetical protein
MFTMVLTVLTGLPAVTPAQGEEKPAAGKALKIFARGYWQHGAATPENRQKGEQTIIRTADELIARPPWNKLDANAEVLKKQATEAVAKALKVDGIDWDKQMLVVTTAGVKPTGGWKVEIQSVAAGDKTLTVRWSVTPPAGFATQALTHPGQVALVERAEGTPKFEMMPGKGPRLKLPERPRLKEFELPPVPKAPPIYECGEKADKELKIFAQAPGRLGAVRVGGMVIRGGQELVRQIAGAGRNVDAATALAAKMLKVEKIDWDKQMIVIVSGGTQRTGGYKVEVAGLKVKDDTLTVHWKLIGPKPGQPVTQAPTNPAVTILVERFDGEVRFDPPSAKSGLDKGAGE